MEQHSSTVRLSDGLELVLQWTWSAAQRFRKATGVDLTAPTADIEGRTETLRLEMMTFVHSAIADPEIRAKHSVEDLGDRVNVADSPRVFREVLAAMSVGMDLGADAPEGQQDRPLAIGIVQ